MYPDAKQSCLTEIDPNTGNSHNKTSSKPLNMRFESCKTSTRKTEEKNLYTDLPHAESRMQIDQMSQGSQVSLQLSVLLTTAKVLLVMVTVIPTDRQTLSCFVIELVSLDMLLLQILIDISLSQYKRARRTMWQQTTARSTYLSRPCMR